MQKAGSGAEPPSRCSLADTPAVREARRGASGWRRAVGGLSRMKPAGGLASKARVRASAADVRPWQSRVRLDRGEASGSRRTRRRRMSSASAMWATRRRPFVSCARPDPGTVRGVRHRPPTVTSRPCGRGRPTSIPARSRNSASLGGRPAVPARSSNCGDQSRSAFCRRFWRMFSSTYCRATLSIRIVQPAGKCVKPCSTCPSRGTEGSVKIAR